MQLAFFISMVPQGHHNCPKGAASWGCKPHFMGRRSASLGFCPTSFYFPNQAFTSGWTLNAMNSVTS